MLTFLAAKSKLLAQVTIPVQNVIKVPPFGDVLSFVIKTFFIIAGLAALIYLLLGALSWITSGGNKENVDKAREKIQAAIIGLILILVVLSVVVLLENLLNIGLGISKPIEFIPLVKP